MSQAHGIDLLHNEEVDLVAKPHPLSFLKYHLFAVYLIFVAAFLGWFHSYLKSNQPLLEVLGSLDPVFGITGMATVDIVLLILFWGILLLSGFGIGVLWVSKMPLIYLLLVGAAGTILEVFLLAPYQLVIVQKPIVKLVLLPVTAVVGMILTEVYRRSHVYVITNYRIITKKGFIGKEERELMYDRITDVHIGQGILGRIFNFGTVTPISSSGFGLGEDSAQALAGASLRTKKGTLQGGFEGGRSIKMPRATTYFSLYGIPKPRKVRIILGKGQFEAKEAPILRRMERLLKEKGIGELDSDEP